MPIHDWRRVDAGIFHDFHLSWIVALRNKLNRGDLPPDYYSLIEQSTLDGPHPDFVTSSSPGARFGAAMEMDDYYVLKRRTLVIRDSRDDRTIALIEVLSPGIKTTKHGFRAFVNRQVVALRQGYHLLIIDLFPLTLRDPEGIHGAIWSEMDEDSQFDLPADKPLMLVSYSAGATMAAYVEPTAVGEELTDMPLFLAPERYVSVPLAKTYQAAWEGVPRRWRDVLEAAKG